MKRQLLGVAAFMLALSAHAQDNPLWMRYCAIHLMELPSHLLIKETFTQYRSTEAKLHRLQPMQRTTLIRYGAPMENKSHLLPTAWAVWIYSW